MLYLKINRPKIVYVLVDSEFFIPFPLKYYDAPRVVHI